MTDHRLELILQIGDLALFVAEQLGIGLVSDAGHRI